VEHKGIYKIGLFLFVLLSLFFLFPQFASAEDSIRVLMLSGPYERLPSDQAESVNRLNGKVFINGQSYKGRLNIIKDEHGLYVIKTLPFEKYIEGVVASEINDEWELEALKAQAVIARTYAMFYKELNAGRNYHLRSSILYQLYKGENTDPLITYAVKITYGEILTYENFPIKAFYHATCEGKTEIPEEVWEESYPYLMSVDCNNNNAPYEFWRRKFKLKEIAKSLGLSKLMDLNISSYTATGRARTVKLTLEDIDGTKSAKEIRATDLRRLLGYEELPSTHFSLTTNGKELVFSGKGYGHGVGLSQWGALEMAKQGKSYIEILAHYYPGTTLVDSEEMYTQNLGSRK
jgi:stage II sporulation protein D